MIDLVTKFSELKEHARKSNLTFRDGIVKYYKEVGEKQGFTVVENSSVIKNTVNYGKVDLVWIEPNAVFCIEFGVLDDIYKHLFRIMLIKPGIAFLILSSNSKCSPEKVRDIVSKTPELEEVGKNTVIIDITGERVVHP